MSSEQLPGPARSPAVPGTRTRSRYGPWVVVTGASNGIGRACAVALAEAGCNVVLIARHEAALEALAATLRQRGVDARVLAGDLADISFVHHILTGTADLDVGLVVLAAGFGSIGPFVDSDLNQETAMIAVNVVAVARLTHHFAERLSVRRRGGLVLFGSIVAGQGTPLQANYAATKAYVRSLGEALAVELRPDGVDVLVVSPGPVDSGFAQRAGMHMPSTTDADVVAAAVLSHLGRSTTAVPGFRAQLLTDALALLPRRLRIRLMYRVMRGMRVVPTGASPPRETGVDRALLQERSRVPPWRCRPPTKGAGT